MGDIRVNFSAMESGQSGIKATHANLVAALDELESNLQPMLQTWDGAAREAYYQNKTQWDNAAAEMATTLERIGQMVGTAGENYRAAEQAATNTWS